MVRVTSILASLGLALSVGCASERETTTEEEVPTAGKATEPTTIEEPTDFERTETDTEVDVFNQDQQETDTAPPTDPNVLPRDEAEPAEPMGTQPGLGGEDETDLGTGGPGATLGTGTDTGNEYGATGTDTGMRGMTDTGAGPNQDMTGGDTEIGGDTQIGGGVETGATMGSSEDPQQRLAQLEDKIDELDDTAPQSTVENLKQQKQRAEREIRQAERAVEKLEQEIDRAEQQNQQNQQ